MEVVAMAVTKVVLSLCCVGACGLAVYLYHILWLVPQRVLAKFKDQKIGGPRPSFPYGNLADMREAAAAAKAARASARRSGSGGGAGIVHDYRPAVLPYYEKWRKEYGLPETKFGGLRRMQNSAETTKTYDLYWFGPS